MLSNREFKEQPLSTRPSCAIASTRSAHWSIAEQYISIQEALTACGITDDLSPTWYPQRFSEMDVEVVNTENSDVVNATFSNNAGQFFSIVITVYNSDSSVDLMRFEKDGSFVEQYVSQERAFYIFSNTNTITAAWSDGHLLIEISGDITVTGTLSKLSMPKEMPLLMSMMRWIVLPVIPTRRAIPSPSSMTMRETRFPLLTVTAIPPAIPTMD